MAAGDGYVEGEVGDLAWCATCDRIDNKEHMIEQDIWVLDEIDDDEWCYYIFYCKQCYIPDWQGADDDTDTESLSSK